MKTRSRFAFRSLPLLLALGILPPSLPAYDAGDLHNEWTRTVDLSRSGTPEQALATARQHVDQLLARNPAAHSGLKAWMTDYQAVLRQLPEMSSAKPMLTEDGKLARFLVGFRMGERVGGFLFVSADGTRVCGEMNWTPDLQPLWILPASEWDGGATVNDMPTLQELLTPSDTFTMGLPVEPSEHPDWTFVDGALDEMPHKCQEERREWLHKVNQELRPTRPLEAALGRRTGTSKCMSVAASYVADWWCDRVGRELPTYTNGVGGQKEYGHDPRRLESLFYLRAANEGGILDWDFQTAPFGKDRVTGERIPFSMRSYARILAETGEISFPDHLVLQNKYQFGKNPFAMDLAPKYLYKRASYEEEQLKQDLETWGPLLAQHTSRNKTGKSNRFVGVHGVVIVGHGVLDGRTVFVYRESFGRNTAEYLEDSFGGPRYRAFPLDLYYQAIAFPHRLMMKATSETSEAGVARIVIQVTTNRGEDAIDPDQWSVRVDDQPVKIVPTRRGAGEYTLETRIPEGSPTAQVTLLAGKRYFADEEGNGVFSVSLPISAGYPSTSEDADRAVEPPSPEESVAAWADELAGEVLQLLSENKADEARRLVADARGRMPGVRRALTARLTAIAEDEGLTIPADLLR